METASSRTARRRPESVARTMAGAALAGVLLVSCTGAPSGTETSAGASPAAAEPTVEALREAREGWKVFTDPARLVSFELPQNWVVQPLQPEPGAYAPDSLHYAVRTPEGTTTAELHSGILTAEAPCPEAERTPYHVIGSEPLELFNEPSAAADIEPRFVVRLITGFRFFGAYGITDGLGGTDGLACVLPNTVQGGEALGRFSFGDLEVLAPKEPANTGPRTVSFATIGEAEAYYGTPEFATIRQMIQSVQVAAPPPA